MFSSVGDHMRWGRCKSLASGIYIVLPILGKVLYWKHREILVLLFRHAASLFRAQSFLLRGTEWMIFCSRFSTRYSHEKSHWKGRRTIHSRRYWRKEDWGVVLLGLFSHCRHYTASRQGQNTFWGQDWCLLAGRLCGAFGWTSSLLRHNSVST